MSILRIYISCPAKRAIFNACTPVTPWSTPTHFFKFQKGQLPENTAKRGWCTTESPENTARSGWYAIRYIL